MELCCGSLVVLGVAAVVWVVAKALGTAPPPPLPPRRRRRWCPGCEHQLLPTDDHCPRCGLEQASRRATQLEHVRFASREVTGLVDRGEVAADAAAPVSAALRARLDALAGRAAPVEPVLARPLDTVPPLAVAAEPVEAIPVAEMAPPLPEPPPPRGGSLAGFMEERNIFWGELVGGLLIVGCSIALVLSLWRTLEQLPYAPFLLAAGVTMALFGAGQYTLHHWRLASTSRGLLVISLLLAPLNLLLLATPAAAGDALDYGVKAAALLAFVAMARAAGRDLIGTDLLPGPVDRRWLLALAVVGAPAAVWVPAGAAAAWLPLACHAAACAAVLGGLTWYQRERASDPLSEGASSAVLIFVGVSLFALCAAWGLLLTRAADVAAALRGLAAPLVVGSVALLEGGLLVQRRLVAGHGGLKATATGAAVAGAALMATGVLLAWPDPLRLTLAAAAAGAVLTRVAWRDGLPWFQIAAVPLLALAFVLTVFGGAGVWELNGVADMAWTRTLLGSVPAAVGYVGFALALAAVADYAAGSGRRSLGVSCAVGGVVVGAFGLLLLTGHGDRAAWPAAGAHLAAALGLLAANVRWKLRVVAQAGMWLVLLATLWTLWATDPAGLWGVPVAVEALALAAAALALTPRAARPGGVVFAQLRVACRDVATAAAVLAVVFTINARADRLHAVTFLTLFPAGLMLARVSATSAFTYAGSAAALAGLAHLAYFTLDLQPTRAAFLPAALTHAWAVVLLASRFGGKRSRERLFTTPLRATARVSACAAAVLLFVPPGGWALEWAGYAAALAALGFVAAWVWREPGSFSPAQAALAAAAVLAGLAWVERQDWWASADFRDPRALRAFGVSLALLGLVWVIARRLAARSDRLRTLWLADPVALDRLVIGAVVLGQLVCLAAAVEPGVRDELTPLGWLTHAAPTEAGNAFAPAAWLLPGLLAAGLLAGLRLRTDAEPSGDAALVGLVVLLLTAPLLVAGTFAPELAAASAMRWGMAAVFVVGSALVFARRPLAELAARLGVRPAATPAATLWAYILLAGAAVVVVALTADVARLGLNRLTPTGPAEASVFAQLGWTWSNVGPMALVVLGLAGTAARERLSGYAFAGGLAFTATVAGGYALGVVTAGGAFGPVENLRLVLLTVGSVAAWAALWVLAERRVPGGVLLDLQAGAGLVGVGLVALVAVAQLFAHPDRGMHPAFAEFGLYGWPLLAVAVWVCVQRPTPHTPTLREHVVGFAGMVAGVIAACAVRPLDVPGARLPLEPLVAVWAAVGLGLTAALFRAPDLSRGGWLVVVAGGLVAAALVGPGPHLRHWGSPVGLAGYALLVAAMTVRVARPGVRVGYRWRNLVAAEVVVAAAAGLLAALLAVGPFTLADRLGGPVALLLLAGAAALLARTAPAALQLPTAAVLLTAAALALVGWAAPDPAEAAVWLKRNGWAFVALVAAAAACLTAPVAALRRPGAVLAGVSLAALAVVLFQQVMAFDPQPRRTPLDLTETLAILAAIAALVGLAVRAALRPGPDPLGLPERRRTAYVYLAEALLVLFFAHVRLNLPELFVGNVARYWTFVVMLLAFVGVGAAEVAERRKLAVLAGPLRRTGVLLPLVPLLAFWAKPPGFVLAFADERAPGLRTFLGYLEKLPQHFDSYAGLWFLGGLLYGLVALQRRSVGWAVLAALAANAGVWSLLEHTGISPTVHPQVWVVPLALIVLIAEHVNRRELKPELAMGLRYAGVGLLYVSSAADMFIAGVGNSLWLPVVLAVFCVAGILGGILLRVRAFLFLGAAFLLLDVLAMIWHAAVDRAQTWVWYASGIVLGAAILALFAVFEKRKNEVREVVDELRRWD